MMLHFLSLKFFLIVDFNKIKKMIKMHLKFISKSINLTIKHN